MLSSPPIAACLRHHTPSISTIDTSSMWGLPVGTAEAAELLELQPDLLQDPFFWAPLKTFSLLNQQMG